MNNIRVKMGLNQKELFLFVVILFSFNSTVANAQIIKPHNICTSILYQLSEHSSEFIGCAIHYSEPVSYCFKCLSKYTNATKDFYNLTITDDGTGTQTSCSTHFIDNDRLNIVINTQSYIKSLWTMGSCSDCYVNDCDLDRFPTTCDKSAHTIDFQTAYSTFQNCSNGHSSDAICKNCIDSYNWLNSNYSKIRKEKGDKFCFDIKDMMNKTRIFWSNKLHCCDDRNPPKTTFYSLASTSACLVIVFYLGIYVYGERQKRINFVENDLNYRVRVAATNANRNEFEATASTHSESNSNPITIYKENFQSIGQDDSDDEAILPLSSSEVTKTNYLQ